MHFLFSVVMENSTERRNLNRALPFKKKLFAYFKYLGAGGEGRKFDFGQFASSTNFLCTNYQTFVEYAPKTKLSLFTHLTQRRRKKY